MSETFFIADTHFGHRNILSYDKRPFEDIEAHDRYIIEKWNEVVGDSDEVYFLGDWAMKAEAGLRAAREVKGKIFFIRGNHDRALKNAELHSRFEWVKDYYRLHHEGEKICLFHYPIHEWDQCHRGAWMLHGHTHGNDTYDHSFKIVNVGANLVNYQPCSFGALKELMGGRKDKEHH